MQSWTRNNIDEIYSQLWPANDIPRRCELEYHCVYKGTKNGATTYPPTGYPCENCNSYRQECKFRRDGMWRPIVCVWQLEYMQQDEIRRLRSFLDFRQELIDGGYVSERP